MAEHPLIGKRVRFAPNPRWPMRKIEAVVESVRMDPRSITSRGNVANANSGWLDTVDDAGTRRSVRPSRCEVVK